MLTSLRSKVLLALTGTVLLSALTIMFFVSQVTTSQISTLQNTNALQLVQNTVLTVENQHKHLQHQRELLLKYKKIELQDIMQLAMITIHKYHDRYKRGDLSLQKAQAEATQAINEMRYAQGTGYIWINGTESPVPRMIMHPFAPELEGKLLDSKDFNSGLGVESNLFVAATNTAIKDGDGYIEYQWPKPNREKISTRQPKLSYVKLFKEWNWVLGTGIYIDDIEREMKKYLGTILDDLTVSFNNTKFGKNGYMYLFNGEKEMLIHPSLAGKDFSKLINPTTGNPILDDLIKGESTPSKSLTYQWEKPPHHIGEFRFWKKSFIFHFEPLDWYIASSIYIDELEEPATEISRYIFFLILTILFLVCLFSLFLANQLTKPLQLLALAAKRIDYDGIAKASVPVTGSVETRNLAEILNEMLESFRKAVTAKEELFTTTLALESRLHKAEKLESVGRLAAGMAHEINTPTQYVSSNISFLQEAIEDISQLLQELTDTVESEQAAGNLNSAIIEKIQSYFEKADWDYLKDEIPKSLNQSDEGLEHIAKIVDAMKSFSQPGNGKYEPHNINIGIQNTVTVARSEWKDTAVIDLQLDETLPEVPCYIDELNQVILRIIVNSVQAIAGKLQENHEPKGRITIVTKSEADHIDIGITDTGTGMSEETLKRIFEPFFTTRTVGEGIGQGLTIVHDVVVNKHHGKIDVKSDIGKGSTFTVSLPLSPNKP